MEDIEKLWQEINTQTEADRSPAAPVFLPSAQNMFAEMVRKVRYKIWFVYAFALGFGGWMLQNMLFGNNREVTYLLMAMFLFALLNVWVILPSFLRMKKQSVSMSGTFRETLEFYHTQLSTIIRQENRLAAIFTPFAAMLGFSYAIIEEKGSMSYIFGNNWLLLTMIGICTLMGALGAWLVVWMNRVAFGKYLAYLRENLRNLD